MMVVPVNSETWLICGGRAFANQDMFDGAMSALVEIRGCPCRVIHGAATGADTMADAWARRMAIEVLAVPAEWGKYGPAAGPLRNKKMLHDHKVNAVIAFPGGRGTRDMVRRAEIAGIDVITFEPK